MFVKKNTLLASTVTNALWKVAAESNTGYYIESIVQKPNGHIAHMHLNFDQVKQLFNKLNEKTGELTPLK